MVGRRDSLSRIILVGHVWRRHHLWRQRCHIWSYLSQMWMIVRPSQGRSRVGQIARVGHSRVGRSPSDVEPDGQMGSNGIRVCHSSSLVVSLAESRSAAVI